MAYTAYLEVTQKIYIAYLGRPADSGGLIYWATQLDNVGGDVSKILPFFAATPECHTQYGTIDNTTINNVINKIYGVLFNRNADPGGLAFWADQFDKGHVTANTLELTILNGAQGSDIACIANKLAAADRFTGTLDPGIDNINLQVLAYPDDIPLNDIQYGQTFLQGVTFDPASVPTQFETTKFIRNYIADPGDPILPSLALSANPSTSVNEGSSVVFTLTTTNVAEGTVFSYTLSGSGGDGISATDIVGDSLTGTFTVDASGHASTTIQIAADHITEDPETLVLALDNGEAQSSVIINDTSLTPTLALTANQDILVGTAGDDVFYADVVQVGGAQANSLGTGDDLRGGDGYDVLNAQVTEGLFMGGGNMPIQPRTSGIEEVKFEALNADMDNHEGTDVFVNAKDMVDVEKIGSWYSDADLTIQDLTTKDASGHMRPLSDMTVTMAYTGNNDSHWKESDLTVYFDQDYLNPEIQSTEDSVEYLLMNEDAYDINHEKALSGVYLQQLRFDLNGKQYDFAPFLGVYQNTVNGDGKTVETYAQMVDVLQKALDDMIAANPTDLELARITISLDGTFLSDIDPATGLERVGTKIKFSIPGLQLDGTTPNNIAVNQTYAELDRTMGTGSVANNNRYERADNIPPELTQEIRTNVDLEKVGLGGDGGDLIIGSMFKNAGNHWNDAMAGKGLDAFDVTVYGGEAQSSSLASLSSTNNTLREVDVKTDPNNTSGDYADLTIGNGNTHGFALKDVQTFNSTEFLGDLTLSAGLTGEVVSKYMNLGDVQADPAADNIMFEYSTGIGNDDITMVISSANLANDTFADDVGTTTREDFNLNISTNGGDDVVTLSIDGDALEFDQMDDRQSPHFAHWYENSKLNANLFINTGDGNDIIKKPGSGDVIINAGAGDDVVYADNSGVYPITGRMATFVFNVDSMNSHDRNLQNLESDVNDSYEIYNGKLTVTFKGFEATVDLQGTQGLVSDLQVNQAIKNAINNDGVLSALLVAKDGPANTLVVESLIDGKMVEDDLAIALKAPTTLTAGEVNTLRTAYDMPAATSAQLITHMNAEIAAFVTKGDYNTAFATFFGGPDYDGVNSHAVSDNTITPGLGNDVIVLGTGMFSNDTVVYEGFGNGNDTIVNFDTTWFVEEKQLIIPQEQTFEQVTLTFSDSDGSPAAETIIFDGATVNLSAPVTQGVIPAIDVAYQFTQQFDSANWGVSQTPAQVGTADVTLTAKIPGNLTDVVAADFTGTYINDLDAGTDDGNGSVTPVVTTQGSIFYPGTESEFTVAFDTPLTAADEAGSFVFDGVTINYAEGDGSITLAEKLDAGVYPDWTTVNNDDGSVTFTAIANGATAIGTAADFDLGTNTIAGTIEDTVGTPDITEAQFVTIPAGPGPGFDKIDFTAYDAQAVVVDNIGTVPDLGVMPPNTATGKYITMVESPTNAGQYTINLLDFGATSATADNVPAQLIGVADFGVEKAFVAANFIL